MTTPPQISGLFRYPVKSLGGHGLARASIEPRGIAGDRRWMVVDETGRFQTRRELPQMARIAVDHDGDGLLLRHPELGTLAVARPDEQAAAIEAKVWRDLLPARIAGGAADAFLSEALGKRVRLVHQPDSSVRPVDPAYAQPGDHVSLSDGFPLLVTTEASLAALNASLPLPIGMDRFRPNLVIAGTGAWDEDRWRRIRIGGVSFRIAKPCSRCIITTQDPATGERHHDNDPLTTLRAIGRMAKGGIMFGQNAIPDGPGEIGVGDVVEVLEAGESNLG
jgi:uncharacterized protein YcbX